MNERPDEVQTIEELSAYPKIRKSALYKHALEYTGHLGQNIFHNSNKLSLTNHSIYRIFGVYCYGFDSKDRCRLEVEIEALVAEGCYDNKKEDSLETYRRLG